MVFPSFCSVSYDHAPISSVYFTILTLQLHDVLMTLMCSHYFNAEMTRCVRLCGRQSVRCKRATQTVTASLNTDGRAWDARLLTSSFRSANCECLSLKWAMLQRTQWWLRTFRSCILQLTMQMRFTSVCRRENNYWFLTSQSVFWLLQIACCRRGTQETINQSTKDWAFLAGIPERWTKTMSRWEVTELQLGCYNFLKVSCAVTRNVTVFDLKACPELDSVSVILTEL